MQIPCYKKIHLNSSSPELIASQLDQLRLSDYPYLINISHLTDAEMVTLNNLAEYISKRPQSSLPYGIYILTNIKHHDSTLSLVQSEDKLPKFFKIKDRSLNNKETALFKRLELLRTNLKNINIEIAKKRIESYSQDHKTIQNHYSEVEFYQNLLKQMRN